MVGANYPRLDVNNSKTKRKIYLIPPKPRFIDYHSQMMSCGLSVEEAVNRLKGNNLNKSDMKYEKEQIEAYQKEFEEYAKNKYPHMRFNFSIGKEFLENKFPKELPEEGLLVSKAGSLVYRLSDDSGYGFNRGCQSLYHSFYNAWGFSTKDWKPATQEQEKKFVEMLKKECEKKGLFEDTKIECHADGSGLFLNINSFGLYADATEIYNKNGQIFYKGKFATPLKEKNLRISIKSIFRPLKVWS